jgi:hypothetical protein
LVSQSHLHYERFKLWECQKFDGCLLQVEPDKFKGLNVDSGLNHSQDSFW